MYRNKENLERPYTDAAAWGSAGIGCRCRRHSWGCPRKRAVGPLADAASAACAGSDAAAAANDGTIQMSSLPGWQKDDRRHGMYKKLQLYLVYLYLKATAKSSQVKIICT